MRIIMSHTNTDFDALASMVAAKKLYPDARLVISDKQDDQVSRFLTIYREMFDLTFITNVDWSKVTDIILVDVASLNRVGKLPETVNRENMNLIVFDHHPTNSSDEEPNGGRIEMVGAAVTLLLEDIQQQQLPLSEFEATLFGLGLYTDTGNLIYTDTTVKDLQAATYLLQNGMNLEIVQRFSEHALTIEQQTLLDQLIEHTTTFEIDGITFGLSSDEINTFQNGLSVLTQKLQHIKGVDVMLAVVKMKKHVHIVGRASSERISLLPVLKMFGGGGHAHAGSATVKNCSLHEVLEQFPNLFHEMLTPGVTAKDIMSSPVRSLSPNTSIAEASRLMYRYGHSGYPIVDDDKLVGIITRRDLDKGNHHGLGHAPVKAYMTTNLITIETSTTLEDIQKLVIDYDVGRLPVLEQGQLVGIVTRSNIIECLHDEFSPTQYKQALLQKRQNHAAFMKKQLPKNTFTLLQHISTTAHRLNESVYLVGGIVRDLFLHRTNEDIDIVVEGDGIKFAHQLTKDYGGEVIEHDSFKTATWTHPSGLMIDITSSRLEYYDQPASLPNVESSTLAEDLQRRDFTINAMALQIDQQAFGHLIDPFDGQFDLKNKTIRVLHNLSFVEDPTRIFRAIRFEQRFQFSMDEQTKHLALNSIHKVTALTPNRIINEVNKLFIEGRPTSITARLFDLHFWQSLRINAKYKQKSCHITKELQRKFTRHLQQQPTWFHYFTIPFYLQEHLQAVETFALTKKDRQFLAELIALQKIIRTMNDCQDIGELHAFSKPYSDSVLLFMLATQEVHDAKLLETYIQARKELVSYFTGQDFIQHGLKPGPYFSDLQFQLEVAQLKQEVRNAEEANKWLETILHS